MSDNNETKDSKSPVNEELIGNLLSINQWLRIVLMILFIFLGWAVRFLQYILVIVQTIIALFTGSENTRLARAGEIAALYQAQIWLFVSYSSNQKPFPFRDLPIDASSLDISSTASSGETYDAEPAAAEEGESVAASFKEAEEPETETVQEVDDSADQDDDEDDVFSDMSFSSAGKDFGNSEDDEDDEKKDS